MTIKDSLPAVKVAPWLALTLLPALTGFPRLCSGPRHIVNASSHSSIHAHLPYVLEKSNLERIVRHHRFTTFLISSCAAAPIRPRPSIYLSVSPSIYLYCEFIHETAIIPVTPTAILIS